MMLVEMYCTISSLMYTIYTVGGVYFGYHIIVVVVVVLIPGPIVP